MLAENVSYGTLDPLEAFVLMMIDDGDPKDRKMRSNFMDPTHHYFGLALAKHKY
jgi:hypothetical protein